MELGKLKQAHTTGEGPKTLSEKRDQIEEQRRSDEEQKEKSARDALAFGRFFRDTYFPGAVTNKSKKSSDREDQLFRLWIEPVIGDLPLKDITPLHLETLKKNMLDAENAARSIRYALAVVRQVFNMARYLKLYDGRTPTANVKFPYEDNRRLRFLTVEEANKLLLALKARSQQTYEIALISLRCGARANEIFKLTWADVNFEKETLTLWDTKNTKTRIVHMTQDIKEILAVQKRDDPQGVVFPGRTAKHITQISDTFNRVVNHLGLNNGIKDHRMKVVFHTLRHTFASWLVENGESLYTVKELMGHSTLTMTERYAHLGKNSLQQAVKRMEASTSTLTDDKFNQ